MSEWESQPERVSPVYTMMLGDIAIEATYANTFVESYRHPRYNHLIHANITDSAGDEHYLFTQQNRSQVTWFIRQGYPRLLRAWPEDPTIAAFGALEHPFDEW